MFSTKVFRGISRVNKFSRYLSNDLRKVEDVLPARQKTTVGKYLAKRLVQAGCYHYFTVPGDFTLSLLDEFLKEDELSMIGCCNELNAGYAADGYARATGNLGAVCVTYMVGGLSTINAVAGAYSDDLPVLCISGGPNTNDAPEHHLIHHTIGEYDIYQQSQCFKPIVAKTLVIRHPEEAATFIDDAIHTALTQRKPVYLEIPVNLSTYEIQEPAPMAIEDFRYQPTSDPYTLEACVEDLATSINNSVKPVLLAGSKLRKTNSQDAFVRLADRLGCGVAIMPDAKGLFPESHESFMGKYWGSVSDHHCAEIVESSDLIILAGPILNDYTTTGWSALLPKNKLLIIEPYGVRFGGNYYPNVFLGDVLDKLADKVDTKNASLVAYNRFAKNQNQPVESDDESFDESAELSLRFMKKTVQKSLTPETSLVIETGDSWFVGQSLRLPDGAKYNVQMQYGSIGWSVGATLGVALAEGHNRRVLALIGDGSFQLTAQEVSTMIRNKVKATIILINNDGYTIEVQIHDGAYNDIQRWNYSGLIDVFSNGEGNAIGLKAKTCGEFVQALNQSESHDGLTFIECFLPRDDCTAELLEWGSRVCKSNGRR